MELKAYNMGACGMVQMFHAGKVKFDTTDIDDGVAICKIPKGVIVLQAIAVVNTVFNAATTNVLTIGTKTDDDKLLASGDITEGTVGTYRKDMFVPIGDDTEIYAKYTQTGTAATTGDADIYIMAVVSPTT